MPTVPPLLFFLLSTSDGAGRFRLRCAPRSASLTNPSHLYLQCDGGCRRATLCSSAWHPGSRMTYTWYACAPSVACGGLFVPTSPSSQDAILIEELELLNLNACQKISDKGIEASTSLCPNLLALSAYWIVGLTDASIGHIVKNCKQIMEFNLSGCKEAIFIA